MRIIQDAATILLLLAVFNATAVTYSYTSLNFELAFDVYTTSNLQEGAFETNSAMSENGFYF